MKNLFKKNLIYLSVGIITLLLAVNILLTYNNNIIIERNRKIQQDVQQANLYFDQVGKMIIHSLDIGLRGFAIIPNQQFSAPMEAARAWKDSIYLYTETPLRKLNYDFSAYTVFKDSLENYVTYTFYLKQLLEEGKRSQFDSTFATDKGAHLFYMYLMVESDIHAFLKNTDDEARARYDAALFNNMVLQVVLFLICVPTLIYMAIHFGKTFQLSEQLRAAERERNRMLTGQNVLLEQKVAERTRELEARNTEISVQSDELSQQRDTLLKQNRELHDARETIEQQNAAIQAMNRDLQAEVDHRTHEIRMANRELIEQNTQLEQFAFIAAHNLRAPLARILGLTTLMRIAVSDDDKQLALAKLEESTKDLDHVIQDLTSILNIKKHTGNLTKVDINQSFVRVKRMLEKEIAATGAEVLDRFKVADLFAVPPYIESILYNLISNAIKYRNPDRPLRVEVSTESDGDFVKLTVRDNGLGIDLKKYRTSMFNLYKRFHLHMEGRGLGLYLVKTQVDALGGKIEVESVPNEGTTFYIALKAI